MSTQQVAKWCRSFQAGREHVENRNMEASGRPRSSRTDINTVRVEEIIQRDRRVTVREIASELDLSYGNVQRIITDELRYSKVLDYMETLDFGALLTDDCNITCLPPVPGQITDENCNENYLNEVEPVDVYEEVEHSFKRCETIVKKIT
ncbi:histone-lysine N-methyltransferase SETMAR [Nephila pilipes]|uniref:Histone-lysine N-methyltransferase SETMAR n=1 Tax=Nephila pilipes TaxID=299642 RepID=A0A8X6NSX8_NEPPI|nr:histone-lysine N-methyltransferase SETMAR [Nephila pilipes]